MTIRPIRTALLSVSDKTGIVAFATFLSEQGVALLSTGGTAKAIREAGLEVMDVAEHTGFPEMLDGRVKTLHPKVHGGLLGKRDEPSHQEAMETHNITPIDLVVINLYPFEQTVAGGATPQECIEQIDIGGPAMIRSAAKNHADVTVIVDPADYTWVQEEITTQQGTTLPLRKELAMKAFTRTAAYDTAISQWMQRQLAGEDALPETLGVSAPRQQALRYGENPHQKAALYTTGEAYAITSATQLQGKELSYNNIADTDAAWELVTEFGSDRTACAIIKHANPCGVALGSDVVDAYQRALACDPVSAYGGILAFNQPFTETMAETLGKHFAEVIIAPEFTGGAKELLAKKKNLRLLETGGLPDAASRRLLMRSVSGGFLVQERDHMVLDEAALNIVTKRAPSEQEMADLCFAFTICKHVKSNAIVYVKDGATVGVGAGQMSRVDSARIGAWKAKETCMSVESAAGSVLASDAFFPFADGLEAAAEQGVTAVIQPGGSIRDEEVIAAADAHDIAMVLTGVRHFKH